MITSNHAMERTADRCAFTFQMTSTPSLRATSAPSAVAHLVLVRPMRLHPLVFLLFAAVTAAASNDTVQTMRGRPIPCELDVPGSWKIVSDEGYRVLALGDGAGLMLG